MAWEDEMSSLGSAVIDAMGVTVTFSRVTPGAMNTTTMVRTTVTSDTTVTAFRGRTRTIGDPSNGQVEQVTYSCLVSALAYRPDRGDQIIDGGVTYRVTACALSVDKKMYELDAERPLTSQ